MSAPSMKIGPLPGRKPPKLSILLEPAIAPELQGYARVHTEMHGREATARVLVSQLLDTYLLSDTRFRKDRRTLPASPSG